ncbi:hypothetical protein HBA54_03115 [Pelagibius litoralis]|uniref:Uncharacterized protein n=1 Tax=Pelagibius litoralis TaxID=374515 RepID=A0A967C6N9_9PROT|nr:hypothetical protein [Pelagibius litoralis]NIA67572.1 hypothetical protein [Pelagibius litoralis]
MIKTLDAGDIEQIGYDISDLGRLMQLWSRIGGTLDMREGDEEHSKTMYCLVYDQVQKLEDELKKLEALVDERRDEARRTETEGGAS